ncbi:hypothetical protein F4678DRAFT_82912 [Xylaria arbuscula]|nr:hypothetical protein F4678DRAFT_82912 [Xylaria arbuscula]
MPRPPRSSDDGTSPDPGEAPKQPSSERAPQGPRQYNHRPHGKFSRRHRNHHSYARQKESRRDGKPFFGARTYPWQPADALELGLHPRTFEELHAEKVYLLTALQSQDHQALELFRRLPALEEYIDQPHHYQQPHHDLDAQYQNANPKVKVKIDGIPVSGVSNHQERREEAEKEEEARLRSARRQRFWVRQQIEHTINAERNLLVRLGELHIEIQCRERWCQVGQERAETTHGHNPYQQPPYWSQYPGPDSLLHQNPSFCQLASDINVGYPLSSLPLDSSTTHLEHGFKGNDDPNEFSLLAAPCDGSPKKHGNQNDGLFRPVMDRTGKGE